MAVFPLDKFSVDIVKVQHVIIKINSIITIQDVHIQEQDISKISLINLCCFKDKIKRDLHGFILFLN